MSENLDLVRSIYAPWERGDYSSAEWAHPDIEFVIVGGPAPGHWKGLAGLARGWRDFMAAWQDLHVEVEAYRELDGERVLVLTRHGGRGKTSGVGLGEIRTAQANLLHIRGGKVIRLVLYWERDLGLADLGLKE